MLVKDIAQKMQLINISGEDNLETEVKGCYIGDLLSLVMSRASEGDAWITVQGNVNVVAVASLNECAMVIIAEGMKLDDAALKRAKSESIPVFVSEKSAFELACEIKELL